MDDNEKSSKNPRKTRRKSKKKAPKKRSLAGVTLNRTYSQTELLDLLPMTKRHLAELQTYFGLVTLSPPAKRWERIFLSDDVIAALKCRGRGEFSEPASPANQTQINQKKLEQRHATNQAQQGKEAGSV